MLARELVDTCAGFMELVLLELDLDAPLLLFERGGAGIIPQMVFYLRIDLAHQHVIVRSFVRQRAWPAP